MSVSETNNVDVISKGKNDIRMIITEHRDWNVIPNADVDLAIKIAKYRKYAGSGAFKEKHGNKKVKIVLASKSKIPENIKKLLKAERIEFSEG